MTTLQKSQTAIEYYESMRSRTLVSGFEKNVLTDGYKSIFCKTDHDPGPGEVIFRLETRTGKTSCQIYKEGENDDFVVNMEALCHRITVLEAIRDLDVEDYPQFSLLDKEELDVLNFCYDLIVRTKRALSYTVVTDLGEGLEVCQKYGLSGDQFTDDVFNKITQNEK
jgi:hypothetical protein